MIDAPVVDLEAHMATPAVVAAWQDVDPRWRDLALASTLRPEIVGRICEIGPVRSAAMDAAGVDVQVLSLSTPGVQNLDADLAVGLQGDVNDLLADVVRGSGGRFQAFATLATARPDQAADELGRAVRELGLDGAMIFGRTRDRNADEAVNWPLYEAAEALNAPLYLHPQSPPAAVRTAYYGGFGDLLDAGFATHGVGWDYETGVQLLRLVLAGVFDRFPGLQIVLSHWGELVLFYLERVDQLAGLTALQRRPSEYFGSNVFVTPGGMFSERYARWAAEVVGADRLMFASDYPFVTPGAGAARDFVERVGPPDDATCAAFAGGTWQRLREGIRR